MQLECASWSVHGHAKSIHSKDRPGQGETNGAHRGSWERRQPFLGHDNLMTISKKSKNSKLKPIFTGVYKDTFVTIREQRILYLAAC